MNLKKRQEAYLLLLFFICCSDLVNGQTRNDSIRDNPWYSLHFQSTVISQQHPGFHAKYAGRNSLDSTDEFHSSVSLTLFFTARLGKSTLVHFDPELSGGEGFSQTTGIAGFPNGEVYRVSDPKPHIYIARLYIKQIFPLPEDHQIPGGKLNILNGSMPESYMAIEIGRFSLMDFFDNNKYSHDPRAQFYNWALMGNGAWDYAANTRGYTYGFNFEVVKPGWQVRFAVVAVPTVANGSNMDLDFIKTGSECLEFTRNYSLANKSGAIRLVGFVNRANMGSYQKSINWGLLHSEPPSVDSVAGSGKLKFGFGINVEQELCKNLGFFMRAGWNDGNNETWVFTEIDRSFSAGLAIDGNAWNRNDDMIGIAQIISGLSSDHRKYLSAGGYGFLIGDGKLNYSPEYITEIYYSFMVRKSHITFSPDYQLIINPAYNKDRGPVHAFGMRMHAEF